MRFDLSDEEWALLEPLLPKSRKSARVDDRKIVNAIFYVLRTGMPRRDLPARYGPYTTAYNRFNRWSPHANRHAKLLIHLAVEGALLGAYASPVFRRSEGRAGLEAAPRRLPRSKPLHGLCSPAP
jgi:Putative transposase of IS4/5 family (DUF4096)